MSQIEADEALARQLQRAEMDGISTPLILGGGGGGSQGPGAGGLGAAGREGSMDEARQTRLNALQKCVFVMFIRGLFLLCVVCRAGGVTCIYHTMQPN